MKHLLCAARLTALSFALVALSISTQVASAETGQLEINAACAVQTGCFPGDTPGYPVRITTPGAYRLTSSLMQTEILGLGSAKTAIEIQADGVDLDLGGFTIGCTNPLGGETCGSGSANGITTVFTPEGTRIANGRIHGMPGHGIHMQQGEGVIVENLRATHNGEDGIHTTTSSQVLRCTAMYNGNDGIHAGGASGIVKHSIATGNGGIGIAAFSGVVSENVSRDNDIGIYAPGSHVERNKVMSNAGDGIDVHAGYSRVTNNVISLNGGYGIRLNHTASYSDNHLSVNTAGTIDGVGVNAGGNVCNSSLTCP